MKGRSTAKKNTEAKIKKEERKNQLNQEIIKHEDIINKKDLLLHEARKLLQQRLEEKHMGEYVTKQDLENLKQEVIYQILGVKKIAEEALSNSNQALINADMYADASIELGGAIANWICKHDHGENHDCG